MGYFSKLSLNSFNKMGNNKGVDFNNSNENEKDLEGHDEGKEFGDKSQFQNKPSEKGGKDKGINAGSVNIISVITLNLGII